MHNVAGEKVKASTAGVVLIYVAMNNNGNMCVYIHREG